MYINELSDPHAAWLMNITAAPLSRVYPRNIPLATFNLIEFNKSKGIERDRGSIKYPPVRRDIDRR